MIAKIQKCVAIAIAVIANLLIIDLAIMAVTMLQIANGVPTPHIPFWDAQIRAVLSIIEL